MELDIFAHGDRQWEKEFLAYYDLDATLFQEMGIYVKQIIPIRSVFRIVTDKGFFCLKKLRFSIEEMNFIMEAIEHLKTKGFKNIFNVVKQRDGNMFLDYNGNKYFLTEWIDGRECDYMNPMDLSAAVEALAELHKMSCGFEPSYCPENRNYLGKWPESFKRKIHEMKNIYDYIHLKQNKNEFDALYIDYADACVKDAHEAISMLSETQYDKLVEKARVDNGFIHHDFAHHNILHSFECTTYVVDFDFCVRDIRIHDLGSLIIRNMKKCNWDVDKAFYIIDCYNNKSSIDNSELKVLVPFFLFPQDFWQISRQYYIERKNWDEEDYLEKMSKKSEYTDQRKRFVDEFIKRI